MGWNPNLDVLSGILGDIRPYVDQNTREKKAANLKFLDRVYAEEQLGKERQYQEDLTGRNRQYFEDLTGRDRKYQEDLTDEERTYLKEQAILERERKRKQAAEQLMGSMGFYGPGGANLPLTPEQLERATDYHGKMFERKRLTDEADRLLVEANTRKANRWLPTVSASPPPYLSSRLTGPALAEQQNRALISMGGKGGVLDIGLHTPDLSEPFRQLVGSDADVWQEMYRNVSGEDEPVLFLDAIKILESSEDPQKVAGLVNNIKARMLPIIKGMMTNRLRQFDEQRFSALSDEKKEGFVPYASVLESGMDRQAEQIFNNMISRMMFDPKTGTLIEGQAQKVPPKGVPTNGDVPVGELTKRQADELRQQNMEDMMIGEGLGGYSGVSAAGKATGAAIRSAASTTVGDVLNLINKKSDPMDWYQQRPTSPEAGIFPPGRSKAELAEWWRELSDQEKKKALGLMSSEERGLLRELYMERPR